MSGICGWSGFSTRPDDDHALLQRMGLSLARFDSGPIRSQITGENAMTCRSSELHVDTNLIVAVATLKARHDEHTEAFASMLARAYLQHGVDCLRSLCGSFALALVDQRDGTTLLAIDRMGISSLYYSVSGRSLVFGSNIDAMRLHPLVQSDIDPQALYDYVYFHMVPGPRTIYTSIRRLVPGEYVLFRHGKLSVGSYWKMRFNENRNRSFVELKGEFLTVLQNSVQQAADNHAVGAFLSGGTDSSTIAGLLSTLTGRPANTYSIGFEAEGYDEITYARIAARHFKTRHQEYYVTPADVVSAIPRIATVHDQPFGNSSAIPTFYCAKLAKADGIETLLGGDGGDELFGGNTRYAKQYVYSRYSDLPELLRKGMIEPIAFALPENISPFGKMQRYIRSATQPMPARYENYNLLERFGPAVVFTPEFLHQVDKSLPLAEMTQAYNDAHATSLINHMLALDLKYTLADNDLPKVVRSCELAGIAVAFPMLDEAVVAFSGQLPPWMKLKGTRLRHFFKEALRGFLPDEIITKKKHGFGLPYGPWLQMHKPLRDLTGDSLHDLKTRGIVRSNFIDDLIGFRLAEHPGYYGTMAWVLMMLEQWHRQHHAA
jgi:asparagine synthase (glutamine-hydrolysing)